MSTYDTLMKGIKTDKKKEVSSPEAKNNLAPIENNVSPFLRNAETPERRNAETINSQSEETPKRLNAKTPNKRPTKRQGMDFFLNQLEKLYDLQQRERKLTGKKPTLPELVSEALDDLFKKKSI